MRIAEEKEYIVEKSISRMSKGVGHTEQGYKENEVESRIEMSRAYD